MADRLKRAAAWLGLVTDDRYPEYDDNEPTEGVAREDLLAESDGRSSGQSTDTHADKQFGDHRTGAASVTPLESRRDVGQPHGQTSAAPVAAGHQQAAAAQAVAEAPVPQQERADLSRIVTVHPRSFNDARTIGEHFRDGVPVIMNLTQMENADAKRLVDFAAGLILGLHGNIERVTSKVFLLSPQNVTVTAEDKERIAGGFFNQS